MRDVLMTEKTESQRNTGRWPKGTSGNSAGRPPGSRNQTTLALEALLEGQAEQLMQKAMEMALSGETTALRLCLERIFPARRDRLVQLDLPRIETAQQAAAAMSSVVAAVGEGQITPGEGEIIGTLLATQFNLLNSADLEERIEKFGERIEKLESAKSAENRTGEGNQGA
jgi:hypothetical protein